MKIAILGAGAFGTALGGILANNGYDIDYYDPKLERENLSEVIEGAKYIIIAIPSISMPYVLPHLPKDIPLIIATKGILDDLAFKDFSDFMILSGPGFADDIKSQKETHFTITDKRIADILNSDYIKFDITNDKKGVLMCGSLKNIYAIKAGLNNLKKDTGTWNRYIKDATEEIKSILKVNGADSGTVNLACGISDLKLTCDTPSRNYQYGQKLRESPITEPDKTIEGLTALRKIKRGEIKLPEGIPIMQSIMEKVQ